MPDTLSCITTHRHHTLEIAVIAARRNHRLQKSQNGPSNAARSRTRSIVRSAFQLRRRLLPAPAAVFVVTLLAAYAVGVWFAVWRHLVSDRIYHTRRGHRIQSWENTYYSFVPDRTLDLPHLAWPLFPYTDISILFSRYPQGELNAPESTNIQIVMTLTLVIAGVIAGRMLCGRLAVRSMSPNTSTAQKSSRRRREARLAPRRVPIWFWAFTAAIGATMVAFLGDAASFSYAQIDFEKRISPGGNFLRGNRYLGREIGLMSWFDFVPYALWAFFAPFLLLVLPARAEFRSRAKESGARCIHCNYPRPRSHRGTDTPCSECGKQPPPPPPQHPDSTGQKKSSPKRQRHIRQRQSRRRIVWGLFSLFGVSLVIFIFTPHAVNARLEYVTSRSRPPPQPILNQQPTPAVPHTNHSTISDP